MRKWIVALLFHFICSTVFSQEIVFARKIIDTLTTPYFAGRGAVDSGEQKAAAFIAKQFMSFGLNPLDSSYYQFFNAPINTFPKALEVRCDNQNLELGADFIVDAASGGVEGNFNLFFYNKKELSSKMVLDSLVQNNFFQDKFIVLEIKNSEKETEVIRALKHNQVNAAGVIFIENKLTHHLSYVAKNYAILHVLKNVLNLNSKKIKIKIDQELKSDYQSQNVLGCIKGEEFPDSFIVLSAHYDHLGKMGTDVYFPGANDNASGVAMLLNFAKHYSQNPPKKTILFIAFGAEESGLLGSKYFVNHPLAPLSQINFVFNMDLMGTGSKGGMIVNGTVYESHYNKLIAINEKHQYLPIIKKRGKAANSDHYWFSEKGVPSFFLYLMGGVNAYHDVEDVAKTLPLTKYENSFRLIRDFVDEL